MRWRGHILLALGAATAVALVTSSAVGKKKKPVERGSIVFGKKKSLWRVAVGATNAKEIAALGFKASRLHRIRSNRAGTAFLVSTKENHYWVEPNGKKGKAMSVVKHVCRGQAELSRDGDKVLCQDSDGAITVMTMSSQETWAASIRGRMATLGSAGNVIVANANGIEGVALGSTKKKTLGILAPDSGLLVAPNGTSAAAVFREDDGTTGLYSFILDGKGVRRKLVTEATPVAWSSDSKWLVVTRKKRGCIVRAVGGQYRCFDGYRALGVSPDLKDALLISGKRTNLTVFRADLGGARSSKPKALLSKVQGSAIWVP